MKLVFYGEGCRLWEMLTPAGDRFAQGIVMDDWQFGSLLEWPGVTSLGCRGDMPEDWIHAYKARRTSLAKPRMRVRYD